MSSPPPQESKPQRILACLLCQQRKVKCSRTFPCTNCIKQKAQCVPATQPRRRRRRFPEKELLDRLRKYEELLRQNGVNFEPLHPEMSRGKESDGSENEVEFGNANNSQNDKSASDPDFLNNHFRETVLATSWDRSMDNEDNILFGSRQIFVDISPLHPSPVHIFKIWQIYLDRVNPLLKVTHAPTLQNRIVEAADNLKGIDAALEALMFSIYCISIASLEPEDCQEMLGSSKEDMLMRFRFGCQQALMNASFLQTDELDCLAALYFYLLSTYAVVHARSLASLLGIAIRTAQRMRIHDEAANSKQTVFEAEMRRRLWWALMLFDSRVNEVANSGATMQLPTWDCKIPLNVGDSELRPDMVETPAVQGTPSDSIFAVIRCETGEFIRHAPFHLALANNCLKVLGKSEPDGSVSALEKLVEKHISTCKEDNPLQFLTIWTSRAQLAKYRLVESYSRLNSQDTNAESEYTLNQALRLLQCDTILMTAPAVKGYHWFLRHYLPFSGYIHIMQNLKTRKMQRQEDWKQVGEVWGILDDNFAARFNTLTACGGTQFKAFTNLILGAWETLEATYKDAGEETPAIVLSIRHKVAEIGLMNTQLGGAFLAGTDLKTDDNFNLGVVDGDQGYQMDGTGGVDSLSTEFDFDTNEQSPFGMDISNISSMEWK